MKATNTQLENELKTLEVQIQQSLDNIELKEKNDKYENDQKKRETPLVQTLKVKEKELSNFIIVNNKFKKKKEQLQNE